MKRQTHMDLYYIRTKKSKQDDDDDDDDESSEEYEEPGTFDLRLFDPTPRKRGWAQSIREKRVWSLLSEPGTIVDHSNRGLRALVCYYPGYMSPLESSSLLEELKGHEMTRDAYVHYGKVVHSNRKVLAFGTEGLEYSYSGTTRSAVGWESSPHLFELKKRLERDLEQEFNYALVNRYGNGKEGIGWHSDAEDDMEGDSIIGSISLGDERDFHLRGKPGHGLTSDEYRKDRGGRQVVCYRTREIKLGHGSLLTMNMDTQVMFKHCIPARAGHDEARFNVTFRKMKGMA